MSDPKTPNFIKSLINYVKNNGTKDDIYDSDSSIYHIDTKKPLGKTEITVDLERDDPFLDAIGLGDDDKYFLNTGMAYANLKFLYSCCANFKSPFCLRDCACKEWLNNAIIKISKRNCLFFMKSYLNSNMLVLEVSC